MDRLPASTPFAIQRKLKSVEAVMEWGFLRGDELGLLADLAGTLLTSFVDAPLAAVSKEVALRFRA